MNACELKANAVRLCVYHRACGIETTAQYAEVLLLRELETGGEEAVRNYMAERRIQALAAEAEG